MIFCPENERLWNVWANDCETLVGRVFVNGMNPPVFVAGERGEVPSGDDGYTMPVAQEWEFTLENLSEIVDFMKKEKTEATVRSTLAPVSPVTDTPTRRKSCRQFCRRNGVVFNEKSYRLWRERQALLEREKS